MHSRNSILRRIADLSFDDYAVGANLEFQRVRHARFFAADITYHVLWQVIGGFYLLTPDEKAKLRCLTAGVIGRAQKNWPDVKLYAGVFLSNHAHLMVRGSAAQLVPFIAFVKREISRRWGRIINWPGAMWGRTEAAALITSTAQQNCLRYILSHGVKEELVERPEEWPGFHCVIPLLGDRSSTGEWLNGTRYGKAVHKRRARGDVRPVDRRRFVEVYEVRFSKIPCWDSVPDAEYRSRVAEIVDRIVEEGVRKRSGRPVLGLKGVFETDRMRRGNVPTPGWFESRRKMVVWGDRSHPDVRAYLKRYWTFQVAYRAAADRWLAGDLGVEFPSGSFRPTFPCPTRAEPLPAVA